MSEVFLFVSCGAQHVCDDMVFVLFSCGAQGSSENILAAWVATVSVAEAYIRCIIIMSIFTQFKMIQFLFLSLPLCWLI